MVIGHNTPTDEVSNSLINVATGIGLTKWHASQNDSPHKTCGSLGSLYIEPYSFYCMKEKALINNFQGLIMT